MNLIKRIDTIFMNSKNSKTSHSHSDSDYSQPSR